MALSANPKRSTPVKVFVPSFVPEDEVSMTAQPEPVCANTKSAQDPSKVMASSPSPPLKTSSPAVDKNRSSPPRPSKRSAPAVPTTRLAWVDGSPKTTTRDCSESSGRYSTAQACFESLSLTKQLFSLDFNFNHKQHIPRSKKFVVNNFVLELTKLLED